LSLISKIFFSKPDIALRTYIIAPKDRIEELVESLVRRGFFEPLPPQEASKVLEAAKRRIELSERALTLFKELNSLFKKSFEIEIKELPWDTDRALEKLVIEFEEIREITRRLLEEAEEVKREIEGLRAVKLIIQELSRNRGLIDKSILDYEGIRVISKTLYGNIKDVEDVVSKSLKTLFYRVLGEEKALAVVIFDRRAYKTIESSIEKLELSVLKKFKDISLIEVSHVDKMIIDAESRLASIESRIEDLLESKVHELALLKALAETIQFELGVLGKAFSSKYLAITVGWSLESRRGELERILKAIGGYVIFEEDENAPVELNNLKPFKPFEIITDIIGYPSRSEWDPTPLITYFYLIFFALMFPDIGYSIGLIIGARLVLPFFVENKETLKKLINIATYAGIAGCVTGLLSNSFFGSLLGSYIGLAFPRLLPSLPPGLSDPVALGSVVMGYIALALLTGYYTVIIAHLVGLIKNVITGRKMGALLEILIILIAIIGPAALQATIGLNTDVWGLLRLLGLKNALYSTLIFVVLYAILKSLLDRPLGAVLWIFDIIGILGDVFSFVRIAGLALGGAVLAELINNLILGLIPSISSLNILLGVLAGAAISILLHIVNLGLSSLGPFIHSLRLVMYEVSTKFYEGAGKRISPVIAPLLKVKIGQSA